MPGPPAQRPATPSAPRTRPRIHPGLPPCGRCSRVVGPSDLGVQSHRKRIVRQGALRGLDTLVVPTHCRKEQRVPGIADHRAPVPALVEFPLGRCPIPVVQQRNRPQTDMDIGRLRVEFAGLEYRGPGLGHRHVWRQRTELVKSGHRVAVGQADIGSCIARVEIDRPLEVVNPREPALRGPLMPAVQTLQVESIGLDRGGRRLHQRLASRPDDVRVRAPAIARASSSCTVNMSVRVRS